MKVSIALNGAYQLKLIPEGPVEEAFMMAAAELAEKGATVALALPAQGETEYRVEVAR